jgi:peptide chain release factor 2
MEEIKSEIATLSSELETLGKKLDVAGKKHRLEILQAKSQNPEFWSNETQAKSVMQEIADISDELASFEKLVNEAKNVSDLLGLAESGSRRNYPSRHPSSVACIKAWLPRIQYQVVPARRV